MFVVVAKVNALTWLFWLHNARHSSYMDGWLQYTLSQPRVTWSDWPIGDKVGVMVIDLLRSHGVNSAVYNVLCVRVTAWTVCCIYVFDLVKCYLSSFLDWKKPKLSRMLSNLVHSVCLWKVVYNFCDRLTIAVVTPNTYVFRSVV